MEQKETIGKETLKRLEDSSRTISGQGYKDLYFSLSKLARDYGVLLAEHNPEFGEFSSDDASRDLFIIEEILKRLERAVEFPEL